MNMKKHKTTIRRILSSIGRYKWGVLASLACALITVVLTLYVPILVKPLTAFLHREVWILPLWAEFS